MLRTIRKAKSASASTRLRNGPKLDLPPSLFTNHASIRSLSTQSDGRHASASSHKSVKPPTSLSQSAKSPSSFATLLSKVISSNGTLRQESQPQLEPMKKTSSQSKSSHLKSGLTQLSSARSPIQTSSSSVQRPQQSSSSFAQPPQSSTKSNSFVSSFISSLKASPESKSASASSSSSPSSNPAPSIPDGPESIRETVRRLQQSRQSAAAPNSRTNFTAHGSTEKYNEPMKGTQESVKSQVLRSVVSIGSAVDFDPDEQDLEGKTEITLPGIGTAMVELEDLLPGEIAYEKKQKHLTIKKTRFNASLPEVPETLQPAYRKFKTATNSANNAPMLSLSSVELKQIKSQHDTKIKSHKSADYLMEKDDVDDDPNFTDFSLALENQKSDSNFNVTDSGKSFSAAELRAQLESRLAKQKEEGVASTYVERAFYINKSGRRVYKRELDPEKEKEKQRRAEQRAKLTAKRTTVKEILLTEGKLTVKELALKLSLKLAKVLEHLEGLGENSLGSDDNVDADTAELLALELGVLVRRVESVEGRDVTGARLRRISAEAAAGRGCESSIIMQPRAPVACVVGHVDHGKTTLLDSLRSTNVAGGEAGGITQRLSAFSVELGGTSNTGAVANDGGQSTGRRVVFLDTPGHAAFSAMRVNGVSATDIAVLVVAMDDGVRPQTIEAARAAIQAKCAVMIALNKVDKIPQSERVSTRHRVLSQLAEVGVLAEELGGSSMVCEISAKTKEGLPALIEALALQAEVMDLKAPFEGHGEAIVLDASLEKGRGVVVNALVRWGTVSVGDHVVVGTVHGKVKCIQVDGDKEVEWAGPSTPVRLLGLRALPQAGQELITVPTEARARTIAERRARVIELRAAVAPNQTPSTLSKSSNKRNSDKTEDIAIPVVGVLPTLHVLLKADGPGTLSAVEKLVNGVVSRCTDLVVHVVDSSVGEISESDLVALSAVQGATVVLAFNVGMADSSTRQVAKELDVKIVRDTVIYRLEDELKANMESLLPKQRVLALQGEGVVRQVFAMTGKSEGRVAAGVSVQSGSLRTSSGGVTYVYKVMRPGARAEGGEEGVTLGVELNVFQLRKFKDVVNEVEHGNECGLMLEGHQDWQEGDIVQCMRVEWHARQLQLGENGDLGREKNNG